MALINEIQEKGMIRLYTKNELQKLCSAYGVNYTTKWNKSKIVKELTSKIKGCTEMPHHEAMSRFTVDLLVMRSSEYNPLLVIRTKKLGNAEDVSLYIYSSLYDNLASMS